MTEYRVINKHTRKELGVCPAESAVTAKATLLVESLLAQGLHYSDLDAYPMSDDKKELEARETGLLKLEALCKEADRLLAKREGIHNMHGSRAAIYGWKTCHENGIEVDWSSVDRLIRAMRITVLSGYFPKDLT